MSSSSESSSATVAPVVDRPWYRRVGPGLITACVVIGPGSILSSSKIGAADGYSKSWVVVLAVVFMMTYMQMGARLGVLTGRAPGDLVAERAGRGLAALIGIGVFFIAAAFQFGNNLGVHSAFQSLGWDWWGTIVTFNVLSISFLLFFKNLYAAVEKLMMGFVALMLLSFLLNLSFAGPNLAEAAQGFIPQASGIQIELLALVGTTFVISAGYFQAYLAQQKGWDKAELRSGMIDARIGSVIMALITLMLIWTAAAGLRGQTLGDVKAVAQGLNPLFGGYGTAIFCLGLFSAAYSSFLVNSMIGGFILSDGFGLGFKQTDFWPKAFTVLVLLTGMFVALYVINTGVKPVTAIVFAQALTVIASPLMAGALLWLCNRRDLLGDQTNGPIVNLLGGLGFLLLLAMAGYTLVYKVIPGIQGLFGGA